MTSVFGTVTLSAVDCLTSQPLANLTIAPSTLTLRPSQSAFHTIKASLTAARSATALPKTFRLLLAVATKTEGKGKEVAEGERDDEWMKRVTGEVGQGAVENWEEDRFVFLRALSGEVGVREVKAGEGAVADTKGKMFRHTDLGEGCEQSAIGTLHKPLNSDDLFALSVAVQTILRTIYLPEPSTSSAPLTPTPPPPTKAELTLASVRIVERPGLNNSTGQRLWDCAISLTAYLARKPDAVWPASVSAPAALSEPPAKRARRSRPLQVVELGAGCGLVGIAAARLLSRQGAVAEVVCTDVEATVTTTLQETLDFNAPPPASRSSTALHPIARTLDWGIYSAAQLDQLLPSASSGATATAPDRTLLGSDILYNPESHAVLLETLLSFLRPDRSEGQGRAKCLIAYKARTEGDDGFFELARGKGLQVEEVWRWGQVGVWEFRSGDTYCCR